MLYKSILLNKNWEMSYSENLYDSTQLPEFKGFEINNAVPGFWEDMVSEFRKAPFFRELKISSSYGIQSYPLVSYAPDMALPQIVGTFFYKKKIFLENIEKKCVICFEGVQNTVSVWINGMFLEKHIGYSAPFEIDIQNDIFKEGENEIVLAVSNFSIEGYKSEIVSGLTNRAVNEFSGGITGDIELRTYFSELKDISVFVSEKCDFVDVKVGTDENIKWYVSDDDKIVKKGESNGDFSFSTENMEFWSPENPKLYTLKIETKYCNFEKKFGVRRLICNGSQFLLNNLPYYLLGVCEHCYYPKTVHMPHDISFYRNNIKTLKKLGFNFIRFHTYVPVREYMQAADEEGMLIQIEAPNNATLSEWSEIVDFCRNYTSVVIYCCGNERYIDEDYINHLELCAAEVHKKTDSIFSPMSAMRGVEYSFSKNDVGLCEEPFLHHPKRLKRISEFSDMYNSYPNGHHSYFSMDSDPEVVDEWNSIYNKPRVSHEICIDGTYSDLSLEERYEGTLIGKTEMFSSIKNHLREKGVLKNAPLYFKNSCEWQRRVRKYCFEMVRKCHNIAGYDFLGPIDTHWHTFGYDVGMMNEFYELKPGETLQNVRRYNSSTVILNTLDKKTNFFSGEEINFDVFVSHFGNKDLSNCELNIKIMIDNTVIMREKTAVSQIKNGKINCVKTFSNVLPEFEKPAELKLFITLDSDDIYCENEWELYVFSQKNSENKNAVIITDGISANDLKNLLEDGKNVIILGKTPFKSLPTSFKIALAGRTSGNLATVIYDHPVFKDFPHDGFCGWQFCKLLEGGEAVVFDSEKLPFNPVIEVVSTHKNVILQSVFFEFKAFNGKLLVCSFNFDEKDSAAEWLKNKIVDYVNSDGFKPQFNLTEEDFLFMINDKEIKLEKNSNLAMNINDKTTKSEG